MKSPTETTTNPNPSHHTLFKKNFYQEQPSLKRQLEENISLLEATLDATHDAILVVDREGQIVRYNKRFAEFWKIPKNLLDAHDDQMLLHFVLDQLSEPDIFLQKVKLLYSQPDAESFDEIRFKDGRIFDRYSRPQYIHGESNGRVWSFRDVTEQRQLEQKLKELLYDERHLRIDTQNGLKMREDFLSMASHELRTPLTPLNLHLQLFQRFLNRPEMIDLPDCKKNLALLTRAQAQVCQIIRLVEDLLDLARISTGQLSLRLESFDLSDLIRDVVERYSSQLKCANCNIIMKIPNSNVGKWDRCRIEQVLTNLLNNAMKFGIGKPIEVTVENEGDQVLICVQDHGIGIAEEDQPRIFNRFERAVTHKQFGGLGLGLYIVKQIVEGHGGKIHVKSKLHEGSSFIVTLPRVAYCA